MFRAGKTSAGSSGATSAIISFGATFSAPPSTILGTFSNTGGGTYYLLYPTVIAAGTTSCTFEFNNTLDSSDYYISWIATDADTITTSFEVPAKPINRISVATAVNGSDHILLQSSSGGIPIAVRVSLDTIKTFINS